MIFPPPVLLLSVQVISFLLPFLSSLPQDSMHDVPFQCWPGFHWLTFWCPTLDMLSIFMRILNLFKVKIIIHHPPLDWNVHFWLGPGIGAISFFKQMCSEHLLSIRHWAKCWDSKVKVMSPILNEPSGWKRQKITAHKHTLATRIPVDLDRNLLFSVQSQNKILKTYQKDLAGVKSVVVFWGSWMVYILI